MHGRPRENCDKVNVIGKTYLACFLLLTGIINKNLRWATDQVRLSHVVNHVYCIDAAGRLCIPSGVQAVEQQINTFFYIERNHNKCQRIGRVRVLHGYKDRALICL